MTSSFKRTAAAVCALFFIGASSAARAQPVTPEMFGALPTTSEAAISPDGGVIATLQTLGGAQGVLFFEAGNPTKQPRGVRLGAVKARSIAWASDDILLLLVSQAQSLNTSSGQRTIEIFRWTAISVSTLKASQLFRNEGNYYIADPGELLATLPDDPRRAVFARWSARARTAQGDTDTRLGRDEGTGYALQSMRLDTGLATLIASGDDSTQDWVVDAAGEAVARVDYDPQRRMARVSTRKAGSNRLTETATITGGRGERFSLDGLSPTPGKAITMHYIDDKLSLAEFDLETGELGAAVFANPDYDVAGVMYDARRAQVTGATYVDDLPRAFHLDPADQRLQTALAGALGEGAPIIESRSADGERMTVRVVYADHPDQFFLFDRAAGRLDFLTPSYAGLDGRIFAAKEKFDYDASDGLRIPGYLTVPAGASRHAMPLVVLPHGGPWARDDQSFDWWAFFYAARGYLVYQPNFRGSSGYGRAFLNAGDGEWGRKMQDDVTEGVKALIASGLVDEKRICIVGASYGGYAALAGATLTPDLYACAVSVNGVSNVPDLIGSRARNSSVSADFWERRVGSRYRDREQMREISPYYQAHRATAPILLIHARDDTVVPIAQSRQMADVLRADKREFVELKGEDHWLSNSETRTEMLARSIAFIDKHIGPKAKAAD